MSEEWEWDHRPGYFGRRRDQKIKELDEKFGEDNWELVWRVKAGPHYLSYKFEEACRAFYEESYFNYLSKLPKFVDEICAHGECMDNALSNIDSGTDYLKQEAYSTHIQDIAVRNVLQILGRKFEGPMTKILVIRSRDSNGYKFGPGNVPFYDPDMIELPSLVPDWAKPDSVEDFWQSNKWIRVRRK